MQIMARFLDRLYFLEGNFGLFAFQIIQTFSRIDIQKVKIEGNIFSY